MQQKFTKTLTTTQTQTFNTKLYDSLEFLRLSNDELVQNILKAVQENPLLDIDFNSPHHLSLEEGFENVSIKTNLKSYLYQQLHVSSKIHNDYICSYIIESLDKNGFFSDSIKDACDCLNTSTEIFMENLSFIQTFEPCGVAALNSIHSLMIQCERKNHPVASYILNHFHKELIKKEYSKIAKELHVTSQNVMDEIKFIQTLTPYPCSNFETERSEFIIPELKIEVSDHQVLVSPLHYYNVTCNDIYTSLMKDNEVLKKYFEDAKTIIANIDKRNARLLLVANEIIKIQHGYFCYGDELQVCKQNEIAEKLGIHPSTVSRAIANKYYEFNSQIYPLSSLFISETEKGSSSDAIKKAILEIIENENKHKPFSDTEIVEQLKIYNLEASRRTINKYRSLLNIPSASKRKR